MISKSDILALIVKACPSFEETFCRSCSEHGADLLYVHAGSFARHLLALNREGQWDEFPAVGEFIERLHVEGTPEVRELATTGVLESIQNVWANSNTAPEQILCYLGPVSAKAWQNLNRFWAGEITTVPSSEDE